MIEEWSEEERADAIKIFNKIEKNVSKWLGLVREGRVPIRYPMPSDIYEAHRRTMKSVATDAYIFDETGRIFLTLRPSQREVPSEPWPNLWHVPGVRHLSHETNEEAIKRLVASEIGDIETKFKACEEYFDNQLSLIYSAIVLSTDIRANDKRKWFGVHDLPDAMLKEQIPIIKHLYAEAF